MCEVSAKSSYLLSGSFGVPDCDNATNGSTTPSWITMLQNILLRTENGNQSSFQWRSSGPSPSLVSSHAPKPWNDHRGREFVYHRDTLLTRNVVSEERIILVSKFMDCHSKRQGNGGSTTQSTTSLAPAGQNFRKGTTSGANDSQNHFYALSSHQVQENSPSVVTFLHKDTTSNLVELNMVDFNIIIGMDYLRSGRIVLPCLRVFSSHILKAGRMIFKIPGVCEFPEVFFDDRFGVPSDREIDFEIDSFSNM
ncbi:hypothetical protein H5410_022371 [Solanum commersonii]|uniref:Uncharacterized protein n=1 Tax=Solanum commersonii TaxID=4109 RepID=A0A9J5ZEL2_SOLCO|nr:hypothetical protein H5410_022371 [Solanum commersonii]